MKFPLGQVVATPAAISAFEDAQQNLLPFLNRHQSGDWGDVCKDDAQANEDALKTGARILSAYTLKTGVKFWIITEADRSSTCALLPEDY